MSEATTLELFRQVHLFDLLDGDPDFREGFTQEVSKQATSDLGNATAFLPHPTQAQTIGGGIGLAGGLAAGMKMPGPWWRQGLAGIGGAAAGAWAGDKVKPREINNGPGPASMFLPDALGPANPSAPHRTTESLLTVPGTGINDPSHPSAGGPGAPAGPTQGSQMIQQSNQQVQKLNTDIADAQAQASKALATPGIQGSSQAVAIRRRIADLEQQKKVILDGSSGFLGQMRQQQGQSLRSLDSAQAQAMRARASRQPMADAMDRWNRSPNAGSWWHRLIGHLVGADNQSSQMASQMRNLDDSIETINQNRGRVQNMMTPGT